MLSLFFPKIIQPKAHSSFHALRPALPWGCIILVSVILLMAGFFTFLNPQVQAQLFWQFGLVPAEYAYHTDLPPFGSMPFWYSAFTMPFIHASLAHAVGNSLGIILWGSVIESRIGAARLGVLFLLGSLGANFGYVLLKPLLYLPTVGASGGASALLGIFLVLQLAETDWTTRISRWETLWKSSGFALAGCWFAFQFLVSQQPFLSAHISGLFAHLGGFIIGLVMGHAILVLPETRRILRESISRQSVANV